MATNGNMENRLFVHNSFWLLQKQLWQTYISTCSIFQALEGAVFFKLYKVLYLFIKKFIKSV